jgi:nitroimidazol reductase NimA-like FMN-containing flavoprotein (pyridoxamine 5'-phosphate oxidase superfamily)
MKPDRMTTEVAARDILKSCNLGTLSMVTPDGLPYGVPINYYFDEDVNVLYLHCALKGKKIDCLSSHPEVSFSVYKNPVIIEERFTTHYDSVIITGHAEILTEPEERRAALTALSMALAPNGAQRLQEVIDKYWKAVAMIKIDIEKIEGKRNRDA